MNRMLPVPVDFKNTADGLVPTDPELYTAVIEYCRKELAVVPDLTRFSKVWAEVEFDGEIIKAVHGVTGYGMRPDVSLFRATGPNAKRATKDLYDRMNGHFADNGWRGTEVFLYISNSETPEQRCPAFESSLEDVGAVPAQRFAVVIK